MARKRLSNARRAAIFLREGGRCDICGKKIIGDYDLDHRIPLALGGPDADENLFPVHPEGCHRGKGSKTSRDVKQIAKAKRVAAKHDGTYRKARNPIPGSKGTRWKKKINGKTERR